MVAVLTREIQAASGYRWARACDAQTAARFILGGLEKVANDAIDRDESHALRTKAMAAEIGALVFFALAHRNLLDPGTPHRNPAKEVHPQKDPSLPWSRPAVAREPAGYLCQFNPPRSRAWCSRRGQDQGGESMSLTRS